MKTINHECYVDLEVAKLLKEAGFDWECWGCYSPKGKFQQIVYEWKPCIDNWNNTSCAKQCVSAPTLEVAQRWLRDVKNFIVESRYCTTIDRKFRYRVTLYDEHGNYKYGIDLKGMSDTYEEALEAGIKKALELVLEEKVE